MAGLLNIIQFAPFDTPSIFRATIRDPVKHNAPDARRILRALLQPLMWRNSKAAVAHEHPLPPRKLNVALLRFSPAEQVSLVGSPLLTRDSQPLFGAVIVCQHA